MNQEQTIISQIPSVFVEDQLVIYHKLNNSLFFLNHSATLIWIKYSQGFTTREISDFLCSQFEIDIETAITDVELALSNWRRAGIFADISTLNHKPWGIKNKFQIKTTLPSSGLHTNKLYKLNNQLFNIAYCQQPLFDSIHPVLKHLSVCESDYSSESKDIISYTLSYQKKFHLKCDHYHDQYFDHIDQLIESIQWNITEQIYRGENWMAVLHSSALVNSLNQTAVFIAPRGSGKSTLAYLLQDYGFNFLADDIVPIDFNGALTPMPMCQRIKKRSWPLLSQYDQQTITVYSRSEGRQVKYVPPKNTSNVLWNQLWEVNAIIYPHYTPTHGSHRINKLSPMESLKYLCHSESVFGGRIDQNQLERLISWLQKIPSYSLTYNKIDGSLIDSINQALNSSK